GACHTGVLSAPPASRLRAHLAIGGGGSGAALAALWGVLKSNPLLGGLPWRCCCCLGRWQFSFWGGDMGAQALLRGLAIQAYCLRPRRRACAPISPLVVVVRALRLLHAWLF
ncbi:hypothetical protein ACCQ08_11050, partial [Comamonas sp. SY3]|uniref:hypothetical protein n=1 Tax=Comamonas sp. SY3 TaxID=3243601 RepID=UPI0035937E3D